MKSKKLTIGKFIFPIVLTTLMFLAVACSDDSAPITPNYPPNIFAKVSGAHNVDYKGQGKLFIIQDPHGVTITSFDTDSTGKTYYLGLNIYFPKGSLTTGTFPITAHFDSTRTDTYAAAFFQYGNENDTNPPFISDTGKITITEIANDKIRATFQFFARDKNNDSVTVNNGSLHITDN